MPNELLLVTLDRFEDNMAVLLFADGQQLAVERTSLPANSHEGVKLNVKFLNNNESETSSEEEARKLLTHILQGS